MKMNPLPKEVLAWLSAERLLNKETCKKADLQYVIKNSKGYIAIPNRWEDGKAVCWKCRIAPGFKITKKDKWFFHPSESNSPVYGPTLWPKKEVAIVYRFEGELDCLLGIQEGLAALTSSTGVGTAMESCLEYVPHGAQLVLGHDNDDPGNKAAEKMSKVVAEQRPDIRLCQIVWPEGFKKDVTDFFLQCRDNGKNAMEEFNHLIKPYPVPTQSREEAVSKGSGGGQRESQADILLRLVTKENCFLFHDQFKEPHARIFIGDHWEIWKSRSKQFKRWLGYLIWEAEGVAPASETLSTVLNVLEAKALFEGPLVTLENRIAWHDEVIWYDLGDAKCRAVRITSKGWEIIEEPPILFRRFSHQEGQVTPERGGSLAALLPFVNLADKEVQGPLLLVYLVSCFVPGIPHPIPNLHGSQGSAKTTLARMLRRIVDPSKMEVLSFPPNGKEFVQQLAHHYFAFFDNISEITDSISDLLCRAVTGEGVSKRELYTDDEDIIYTFRRCIGLNGINPAAKKPDLLDRSILMKLQRIPEDERKEERIVLNEFDAARPQMLGAIFDALTSAMCLRDSVRLARLPRMADFTRWGCAIAQALGYSQDDFLKAYYANIAEQNQEAIQGNPVAAAMKAFMQERTEWEGTMSGLYDHLAEVAEAEKIDTHAKEWPKAANSLSRRLNEADTNLKEIGIVLRSDKGTHGKRVVLIQKVGESIADIAASPLSAEQSDQFGGNSGGVATGEDTQVSLPIPPPEESQEEAIEEESGDGGDIPITSKTLRDMGFFQR